MEILTGRQIMEQNFTENQLGNCGVRVFSICQNWQAGLVVLIVKWTFSTRFSHKSTITMYNIYVLTDSTEQIWLTTEFCSQINRSGRPVLTNGKHPKDSIWLV